METDEVKAARKRIEDSFRSWHRVTLDDLVITDVPGYWRDKEAGRRPGWPIGWYGKSTYRYVDPLQGPDGRFQSPYRTWRIIKDAGDGHKKGSETG